MAISILYYEDASPAFDKAKDFLMEHPILNNVNLTLLEERIQLPQPGRYWVCMKGDQVVGFGLQSPLNYGLNVSPMDKEVIKALVHFIEQQHFEIPYVTGDSYSTALFAGAWTESYNAGALPKLGLRIYEKDTLNDTKYDNGIIRKAKMDDLGVLVSFMEEFNEEIGEQGVDIERVVQQRLEEGRFWIWEDDNIPVAYVCISNAVARVVRIQMVYTSKQKRGNQYARACANIVSNKLLQDGYRVMLYTDLGNPVSNFVFRTIGFKSKMECLKYIFVNK